MSALDRGAGGSRRRAERAAPGCWPGFGFRVELSVQQKEAPVADGLFNPEGITVRVCWSATAVAGLDRIMLWRVESEDGGARAGAKISIWRAERHHSGQWSPHDTSARATRMTRGPSLDRLLEGPPADRAGARLGLGGGERLDARVMGRLVAGRDRSPRRRRSAPAPGSGSRPSRSRAGRRSGRARASSPCRGRRWKAGLSRQISASEWSRTFQNSRPGIDLRRMAGQSLAGRRDVDRDPAPAARAGLGIARVIVGHDHVDDELAFEPSAAPPRRARSPPSRLVARRHQRGAVRERPAVILRVRDFEPARAELERKFDEGADLMQVARG